MYMKIFTPIVKSFISKITDFTGYSIAQQNKVYSLTNVSPGPATINPVVIEKICQELNNKTIEYTFGNTPLEMSHRSPEFEKIMENVNKKIRFFMEIPDDFEIIWTQGGGHGQFSAIPLNMKRIFDDVKAGYMVTGTWSSRAFEESKKFINSINICEHFYKEKINKYPIEYNILPSQFEIPDDINYLYICSNETVNGTEFRNSNIEYPSRKLLGDTKLVVDMSSDFLMKKIDWNNIDVAFACTSKNMGVAGANILIVDKKLLNKIDTDIDVPCILDWKLYSDSKSLYNTPAVFNFYLLDYILDNYIEEMKNITQMDNYNQAKAQYIYDFLDESKKFSACVKDLNSRSNVNIPFIVGNGTSKERTEFLEHCYNHNIVGLRTKTPFSYESMGLKEPLRISLYNGIKLEDVQRIIKVMDSF